MNIFDWLNEISYNKRDWNGFTPEQLATFDAYMINRFISMKQDYIELISDIQQLIGHLPKKNIYNLWCSVVPKKKTFFRYIKAKRPLPNDKLLVILANHFNISKREVKDNYPLLGKDIFRDILQEKGIDDKQIKKLLK